MEKMNLPGNPAENGTREDLIRKFEEVGYDCKLQSDAQFTTIVFRPAEPRTRDGEARKGGRVPSP